LAVIDSVAEASLPFAFTPARAFSPAAGQLALPPLVGTGTSVESSVLVTDLSIAMLRTCKHPSSATLAKYHTIGWQTTIIYTVSR
jgi:hypothetical protein